METFQLPPPVVELINATKKLRAHYQSSQSAARLKFTLDGNLVGDMGEAIASEIFGIHLVEVAASAGIDGYAPDGKTTVQIKATGTGRGPAFSKNETRADHLIFLDLD